ncbi:MAG: leucine-rich repeat domain-containing protein [Candidatus Hodarchaeota archaeon]
MSMDVDSESNLLMPEAKSLRKLQRQLGRPLPKLAEYQFEEQGYFEDNNQIISLNLQNMKLESLPKTVGEFSNLRTLLLKCNNINYLDLSPLKLCSQLRILDLGHNQLQNLDISPIQHCHEIRNIILNHNQLQTIDLSPLQDCAQLTLLNINNNQLENVNLDFLNHTSALWSLDISDNPLTSLDITPLLSLPKLELFSIDDNVAIEAFPVSRDYANELRWFISEYLPRTKWIMTKEDAQYESLFAMYQNIVKHFHHDEFWLDYRNRRLAHPPQPADSSYFFEYTVDRFLAIKDRKRTDHYNENAENYDIRTPWRRKIEIQLQDRFLNALDLASAFRNYWETGNESKVTVDLLEGAPLESSLPEIIILHFWLGGGPSQLLRVSTITWVRISVDEDTHSYQVRLGFNRGYLRKNQKFHPIPPPEEFPLDVFVSTEVRYEIKSFTTSNTHDILTRGHDWLKEGYYPKFDPDWPELTYFGDSLQLGF